MSTSTIASIATPILAEATGLHNYPVVVVLVASVESVESAAQVEWAGSAE